MIEIGKGYRVKKETYEKRKKAAELNYGKPVPDTVVCFTLRGMLESGVSESEIVQRAETIINSKGIQVKFEGVEI